MKTFFFTVTLTALLTIAAAAGAEELVTLQTRDGVTQSFLLTVPADGKPAATQFLANLHPMWTDELSGTSPWLGLRGIGEKRPVFRNLKLTGSPIIPREVKLTDGQQLRGWIAGFYGEKKAAYHAGCSL